MDDATNYILPSEEAVAEDCHLVKVSMEMIDEHGKSEGFHAMTKYCFRDDPEDGLFAAADQCLEGCKNRFREDVDRIVDAQDREEATLHEELSRFLLWKPLPESPDDELGGYDPIDPDNLLFAIKGGFLTGFCFKGSQEIPNVEQAKIEASLEYNAWLQRVAARRLEIDPQNGEDSEQ